MSKDEKSNVISFQPKKQDAAEDPFTKTVDEEVKEELKKADEHIGNVIELVSQQMLKYALECNEKQDITIPLQSLISLFSQTASELDHQLPEEVIEKHANFRVEMANDINKFINSYMKEQEGPIFQQDVYVALSYVLASYLYQQRVFTFTHYSQDERRGKHEPDPGQN